jgi:hypothetical protein
MQRCAGNQCAGNQCAGNQAVPRPKTCPRNPVHVPVSKVPQNDVASRWSWVTPSAGMVGHFATSGTPLGSTPSGTEIIPVG